MKMFIIGVTGSGKTTLARKVAEAASQREDVVVISASGWVRALTGIKGHSNADVQVLTERSKEELAKNPTVALDWVRGQIQGCRPTIIEGCRNPVDFFGLYDPCEDYVVFIVDSYHKPASEFESVGLHTIRSCVQGMVDGGFMPSRFTVTNIRDHLNPQALADLLLGDR